MLDRLSSTEIGSITSYPWIPDLGDGTYRNPVIHADYSDPDVVRVFDDYYLVSSSFNCTPGLPILHSRDLVNWTLINHAVQNLPFGRYREMQGGSGVWAPSIRFHDGRFWIFFPLVDEGIFVTMADDPRGEWSAPHQVVEGRGLIDPCPLWDDDGSAYLVYAYARSRAGIKDKLRISPMAPDASRLLGEGHIVFDEPDRHPTIEGPKFMKRDGWYYIFAPAGGVQTGWQTVLRSRSVYGPYEDRIVFEQGITEINGPHQGAFVDTPAGAWWFIHFQDTGVYGRITHLQPSQWLDGWPVIGNDYDGNGIGEPISRYSKPINSDGALPRIPACTDKFEDGKLGLQWQWNANHGDEWASVGQCLGLRLLAQPAEADLAMSPHLLMQKFPARTFAIETNVKLPQTTNEVAAGLVVLGGNHAALSVSRSSAGAQLTFSVDNIVQAAVPLERPEVRLFVSVRDGGLCEFLYSLSDDSEPLSIGEPFQAMQGHWIGARVGLYCSTTKGPSDDAYADFEHFTFSTL